MNTTKVGGDGYLYIWDPDRLKYRAVKISGASTGGSGEISGDVYSKTEVDNKIKRKADKSYVDSKLDDKADSYKVYDKASVNSLINIETQRTEDAHYTKSKVNDLLSNKQDKLKAGKNISIDSDNEIACTLDTSLYKLVSELPTKGDDTKIYLKKEEANGKTNYVQYGWLGNAWRVLGSSSASDIDLDNYYDKDNTDALLEDKQDKEDAEKTYVPYSKNTENEKSIKLEVGNKSIYVSDSKIYRKTEAVESDNVVWHSELDGLIPDSSKKLSITSEYIEEATKDLSEDDKKDYTKLPPEIVLQKILDTVMVLDNMLYEESDKESSDVMIEYEQGRNIDYYTMLVPTDGDEEYYVNDCQYKLYTDGTKNVAKAIPGFLSGIKDKYNTVDFSVHGLKLNVEYTDDKAFVLKGTLDDDKFLMSVCTPTDGSEPLIAWKRTRLTDFTTKDKEKLDNLNSGCIYLTADTKENTDYRDPSNKVVSLIQSDYQEDKYIAQPVHVCTIHEMEDNNYAELKFEYNGDPSDLDSKHFMAYLYNEEDGSQFNYDIEPFCKQLFVRVDYSTRERCHTIAVDARDLFPITNCINFPRQDFGEYTQQLIMKYKLILIPVYSNGGTPKKALIGKAIVGDNDENPETVKVLISGYDKDTYEDIDELHMKILSKLNPTIL